MRPKLTPELHLIQLRNADAVLVGGDVLRHNVHCHFAEEKIRTDPSGCCDAGCFKHIEDDLHGEGHVPRACKNSGSPSRP